ncbi:MAG: hypothetical protein COV60_00425 [Candidatus Magasanikbacteria bacterium CG11_big_fil_rev_8_21_14_0_20_43_7]|uniref:Uncharacterized protein n=1 Tax=Candidatus Magasanikbacteria bacterium CG11_big_fil_rev_8_21_14_0_20_43_7 TaxID=1974654 RepID=A0A2H0N3E5_9BACT|nr:MAG: hypothetical protein COV60_00425 [Candidatus Magasanikbacteria bacterium CG11_big_fil_rev_8_21_14_0_20_43_7]
MNALLSFLESQRLVTIALASEQPWICSVYYGVDKNFRLYFISNKKTKHSQYILSNPAIAFSVSWYNAGDYKDRKAVQGIGNCRVVKNDEEIITGVHLHNLHFPEFADRITVDWIQDPEHQSAVWIIEPTYIKFWNDELFGSDEIKEFTFET